MQRLPAKLVSVEMTSGMVDVYTAPANTTVTISAATIQNKTGTARLATIQQTPATGTATYLCYNRIIGPNETFVAYGLIGQSIAAAGKISVQADSGAALDFTMSGYLTT